VQLHKDYTIKNLKKAVRNIEVINVATAFEAEESSIYVNWLVMFVVYPR